MRRAIASTLVPVLITVVDIPTLSLKYSVETTNVELLYEQLLGSPLLPSQEAFENTRRPCKLSLEAKSASLASSEGSISSLAPTLVLI